MWREIYLKNELLSIQLQVCGVDEKGRNIRALTRLVGPGKVMDVSARRAYE
jgi:hypothetical protein